MSRHPIKCTLLLAATLMAAGLSSQAVAQSEQDREACEGDVFNLCQDKIPDEDEIVACLRRKWSNVSKECRHVMLTHRKGPDKTGRTRNAPVGGDRSLGY